MSGDQVLWQPAPKQLKLGDNDLQLWQTSLSQPADLLEIFQRTLTPDERNRANRFRASNDRKHFVVAHFFLRTILASYLQMKPEELRFQTGPQGKPALLNVTGDKRTYFNLSHSNDLALFAINSRSEVGIDVEYVRKDVDTEQIAARFFSPKEIRCLNALSFELRREGFFRCWTRKEAYIKATGKGLSLPLNQFAVSVGPTEPLATLEIRAVTEERLNYSLFDVSPGADYVGAVAVEGFDWQLSHWKWTP